MYIYSVLPLKYTPPSQDQYIHYFSPSRLEPGQLVRVRVGKTLCIAVILRGVDAYSHKQILKKHLSYTLKKIDAVLTQRPVVPTSLLHLVDEVAVFTYESAGLILKYALPKAFYNPTAPFLKELATLDLQHQKPVDSPKPILHITDEPPQHTPGLVIQAGNTDTPSSSVQERREWIESLQQPTSLMKSPSSVFFPTYRTTPLIINKENHTTFKQAYRHPYIDGHLVARFRNQHNGTPLHLYDVIPSLESFYHALRNKWEIQYKPYHLAPVTVFDMNKERTLPHTLSLSKHIQKALRHTQKDEKVLLFVHQKGLATALMCKQCQHIPVCQQCSRSFVQHSNFLMCHICLSRQPVPKQCLECKKGLFIQLGGGSEKVEQLLKRCAGHLSYVRLDNDTAPTPAKRNSILKQYTQTDTNVLITTHTLHTLPRLTWSGIISLDTLLNLPTPSATEEAFALMWRMRNMTQQNVYIQTYIPQTSVFSLVQQSSFKPFLKEQLHIKKALGLPPFTQLIYIAKKSKNEQALIQQGQRIVNILRQNCPAFHLPPHSILGPAPSYVAQQRGLYKWYIVIKYPYSEKSEQYTLARRNELLKLVPPQWDISINTNTL